MSVDSAEAAAAADAANEKFALSERLVDQQLRPEDIKLADGPDGKPFLLGKGGFGEVRAVQCHDGPYILAQQPVLLPCTHAPARLLRRLQRCSGVPGGGQG